ncbi:MAG: FAD:protein FMN transferase, partial [Deltaproteobacteria bacterium]|nr:FAD:protein FMN transferase [Deltaproteobacteria bacterium]
RVGVNLPSRQASDQEVYSVIPLSNLAMATSGDYRNFFEKDGIMYSHILDPRTGYPVRNGVVSVTVIVADCTFADGLATAVMVMGADKGRALIERLPGVEGLIIQRNTDNQLVDHATSGFAALTQ